MQAAVVFSQPSVVPCDLELVAVSDVLSDKLKLNKTISLIIID